MALEWTSPASVRDRWVGEGLTASDPQISTLLEDAEDTILREFPDMRERIARADGSDTSEGPATPLRRVAKVAARMVMRHLRNPGGERSVMEQGGPFSRNVTFGGDEPGALYLTDEDRAELGGHRSGGAFTIDTIPSHGYPVSASEWLDIGSTWYR